MIKPMALFGKKDKKKKGKKGDEDKSPEELEDEDGDSGAGEESVRAKKSGDGESGEGEDGEELDLEGDGKKSKKTLFIIIGAVVLLIAAGAGAYFSGLLYPILGKKGDETSEHASDDGHGGKKDSHGKKGDDEGHGAAFMELPDLVVNLSTTQGQPRYLKLKVQLELESAADQAAVEQIAPRVIDHFQTYLRELRVSDLRGSAGVYRLRQELLARVNAAVAPIEVKDVLFQEILIQ